MVGNDKIKRNTKYTGPGSALLNDFERTYLTPKQARNKQYSHKVRQQMYAIEKEGSFNWQGRIIQIANENKRTFVKDWDVSQHKIDSKGRISFDFKATAKLGNGKQAFKSLRERKFANLGKLKGGWAAYGKGWANRLPKWMKMRDPKDGSFIIGNSGMDILVSNNLKYASNMMREGAEEESIQIGLNTTVKQPKFGRIFTIESY